VCVRPTYEAPIIANLSNFIHWVLIERPVINWLKKIKKNPYGEPYGVKEAEVDPS
jgi:hypothetical protein